MNVFLIDDIQVVSNLKMISQGTSLNIYVFRSNFLYMYVYTHIYTYISSICIILSQKVIFRIITSKRGNTCIEANISEHSLMRINEMTKVFKILE